MDPERLDKERAHRLGCRPSRTAWNLEEVGKYSSYFTIHSVPTDKEVQCKLHSVPPQVGTMTTTKGERIVSVGEGSGVSPTEAWVARTPGPLRNERDCGMKVCGSVGHLRAATHGMFAVAKPMGQTVSLPGSPVHSKGLRGWRHLAKKRTARVGRGRAAGALGHLVLRRRGAAEVHPRAAGGTQGPRVHEVRASSWESPYAPVNTSV